MRAASALSERQALKLLGLKAAVDQTALKAAFRKAAKASRPDHDGGDAERFRQVIEAYKLLQRQALAERPAAPAPKPKTSAPLEITPAEAMTGLARRVQIAGGKALGLRLPAGLRAGETVRLVGQGEDGGDLTLTVTIKPDGGWRVRGDDLWVDQGVEPQLLETGGRLAIETPSGRENLRVPRGLNDPYLLRIKDKGLPARDGRPGGHLFVNLKPLTGHAADPAGDRLRRFRQTWASSGAIARG